MLPLKQWQALVHAPRCRIVHEGVGEAPIPTGRQSASCRQLVTTWARTVWTSECGGHEGRLQHASGWGQGAPSRCRTYAKQQRFM